MFARPLTLCLWHSVAICAVLQLLARPLGHLFTNDLAVVDLIDQSMIGPALSVIAPSVLPSVCLFLSAATSVAGPRVRRPHDSLRSMPRGRPPARRSFGNLPGVRHRSAFGLRAGSQTDVASTAGWHMARQRYGASIRYAECSPTSARFPVRT